ncbi:molybdopterin-dependent oxidoreductase [Natronorarus salvus]|uniref:molybdopterin-dependent oxidoreductase n=1 Tax=Natronorarus salvus TaxID=3117733 RepID=UPI002F261F90
MRTSVLFARLAPPPRLVDWSILVLVVAEVASGLLSFTVGTPDGWYVLWFHRVAGITLAFLLGFKLYRVRHRIRHRERWKRSTALSILTACVAIGALVTGVAWALGLVSVESRVLYWTFLSVHVGLGLALVPLVLAHMSTRFRVPKRTDFADRRDTIRYAGLFAAGALVVRAQETLAETFDTPGADRRFTGSRPVGGEGNGSFPITSWVADDPDPIDPDSWTLSVTGLVDRPLSLPYDAVDPRTERRAVLDCTSGWYTVQNWRGIRIGDLLDSVEIEDEAEWIRFVSVTGYRWSLPVEEARDALLATHIGGERLTHGHGAPVRLVAPGRRGFQWVKWVERVELRAENDPAQWLVTLVSGFD